MTTGCLVDLTQPQAAFDSCLAIINATPRWPQLLAYGVATLALSLLILVLLVWLLRNLNQQ